MTCRTQATIIDLEGRKRIAKLFGRKPTISDALAPAGSPAIRAYQAPLDPRARPVAIMAGKGGELAPIYDGDDARPCDTEPAA